MVRFTTTIKKFAQQGEKTGWTYIEIPAVIAKELNLGSRKSFRVKGKLDDLEIEGIALIPMGDGHFIMALNAKMRKCLLKSKGSLLKVKLEKDDKPLKPSAELIECLNDEPVAQHNFNKLPKSHQNYFSRWIESAKTESTKTKRIAHAIDALTSGTDFGTMLRKIKNERLMR